MVYERLELSCSPFTSALAVSEVAPRVRHYNRHNDSDLSDLMTVTAITLHIIILSL